MDAWDRMSVAERIELTLRCMDDVLPHDRLDEAVEIADKGKQVYAECRHMGFEKAAVKARVWVIREVLKSNMK